MRPAALLFHVRHCRARRAHLRHDLDLDVVRELLIRHLVERRLPGAARIVDDDIDAPEAAHRLFDEALHVARLRRVRHHRQNIGAEFSAFGGLHFHDVGAARANRDHRAELRDARRRRTAYAFAAAGDGDDLAFQTQLHGSSFFIEGG